MRLMHKLFYQAVYLAILYLVHFLYFYRLVLHNEENESLLIYLKVEDKFPSIRFKTKDKRGSLKMSINCNLDFRT